MGDKSTITPEIINVIRFYIAWKIVHCKNCEGIIVIDWEPPIIFKKLYSGAKLCEKHQKELDEFNHRFASD